MYTTTTITSTSGAWAEAFVTKNKKRLKQQNGIVYLKDQDEYEIELFNPTAGTILAEISIDGKKLPGGGIILKPGQRVFLERYLDSPRKFKFSTYEVEAGVQAVENAIANNGRVEVRFYSEKQPTYNRPNQWCYLSNALTNSNFCSDTNVNSYGGITTYNGTTTTTTTTGINSPSLTASTSTCISRTRSIAPQVKSKALLKETGQTERGSQSHQTFKQVDLDFYPISFWNVSWVIKPESTKKYTAEEAAIAYCGNCGAKRKKSSFKFCPHCGTKY